MRPISLLVSLAFFACALTARAQTPPASFATNITVNGQTMTVNFLYHPIRSSNFAVHVQQADGSWASYDPGPASTYLGTVAGQPGALACGTLLTNGQLWAKISFENGTEWVYFSGPSARAYSRGGVAQNYPSSSIVTQEGGAGTNIYAAEMAVDSGWNHYNACGGDLYRTVMAVEHSILSGTYFYIRDNGVLHQVGAVYIRADYAQDPYHSISAAGGKLDYCRVFLSGIDPTHDVGTVADSIGGGVAWVGTIGTWVKYSACGYNGGENGDFSQVWRHEVGHNWNCGDWEGGSAEGSTIMNGNSLARCSGPEENKIVGLRNGKLGILDNLGPYSFPLPPRASMDTAMAVYPNSTVIDVLRNDHSGNGLPISLLSFDATSSRGGTLTRSVGTGPGGRDQIIYSPPATSPLGTDKFSYRITDTAGRTGLGYALVIVDPPANDLAGYWPVDEGAGAVAHDGSGSASDGTVQTDATWVNGILGNALQFNGSTAQVSVPALNLNTNTVTITCWVRRNGAQVDTAGLVFTRGNGTVAGLNLQATSNQLAYHWNDQYWNFASGLTLPDGQWTFCALVVEASRAVLYLDDGRGLRSATNTASHAVQSFGSTLYFGREANGGRFFKGMMDDIRIYRRALSGTEVALVAMGMGTAYNPIPSSGGSIFGGSPALQWLNPPAAGSQRVFLGTDYNAVALATTNSPEYMGALSGTEFMPALAEGTWYWRVDEVYATQVVKGPVWFFSYASGDPIARWKLDEITGTTFVDSIGGNNGTSYNSPTLGQAGVLIEATNRAVRFNGSTQRIDVPFNSSLNTTSFTVEVWCKVTGGMGTWRSPLTSRDDNPTRGFNFYAGTDNKWQFWTGNGSTTGWNSMTGPDINTNQWVQLVGVVNGNFQSFYVNGVLAASSQATYSINAAHALHIGSGESIYYFPGLIDDVRLYNRPLTAGEIASRYQQSINQSPFFAINPIVLPGAPIGAAYSNAITANALDPNPNDTVTFAKVSGSAWLAVAADGTVTGTPTAGDTGLNSFVVRASDSLGASATATLQINVGGTVWNGGGVNNYWNLAANWSGTTPANSQGVAFSGLVRRANTNNLLSTAGQIAFLTPGFSLYGNALTLTNGIISFEGPNLCAISLTLSTPQSFASSNDLLTVSGTVNNNGQALAFTGTGDIAVSGLLSGAGSVNKAGKGALTLSNPGNTFSGALTASEGTVTASGQTTSASGASALGTKSSARSITVNSGATMQFAINNVFGGSGMNAGSLPSLVINGTLNSARFNVLPNLALNGGTLTQSSSDSGNYEGYQFIGSVTAGGLSASTISTGNGKANHLPGGAATTFVVSDATGEPSPDLVISAPLRDGSGDYAGSGGLTKAGAGTLLLLGTNTYTGTTTVSAGTLAAQFLPGNQPLGTGPVTLAGGCLALQGPPSQQCLALTGFNQDVIFARTEASAAAGTTRGIDNANYVLYETNAPGSSGAGGLPGSGAFTSKADPAVSFQFQPYAGTNALTLSSGSGTLALASPMAVSRLNLLHTSGSGSTTFNLVVNYSDGTSNTVTGFNSGDWGVSNAAVALVVRGRALRGGAFDTGSTWYLFQSDYSLPAGDQAKTVSSVTVVRTGGAGVLNVFAISATAVNGPVNFANPLNVAANSTLELRGPQTAIGSGALTIGSQSLSITGAPGSTFVLAAPTSVNGAGCLEVGLSNAVFSGLVSGAGSLTKLGNGTLTLGSANSYLGQTIVGQGKLTLAPGASISSSASIVVAAGAALDDSDGLVVAAAQALKGNGTVIGSTIVNGRLEPGTSIGKLTVTGDVTLNGTAVMELSKAPLTNDQVAATGTITYGGVLSLTNISAAPLAGGESFKLFTGASYSGSFSSVDPVAPGPGLAWDASGLATNGTLKVVATVSATPTNLTWIVSGNLMTLSWPSSHIGWTLQAQTNALSAGLGANWSDVPGSSATNRVTLPIDPANPTVFFRLKF